MLDFFCSYTKSQNKLKELPTFLKEGIQKIPSGVRAQIKAIIDLKKYYSLNLDEWTIYNYNFIGITITFDDCYYLLCLNAPDDLSRSADVIARVFKDSLSFYNIKNDKIIFTTTDSASSVKKAINISGIKWFPCCAHILNRTFLDWVSNDSFLQGIIKILSVLYNSCQFKQYLNLIGSNFKSLPSFIEIRWLSLFNTLHRAINLKDEIIEFYLIKNDSKELLKIKDDEQLNDNDWIYLESIIIHIERIANITKSLESDSNDSFFNALDLFMELYQDVTKDMISSGLVQQANYLKNGLYKRLVEHEGFLNELTIAAILNPNLDHKLLLPDELQDFYINAKKFIKSNIPMVLIHDNFHGSPRSRKRLNDPNEFKKFKKIILPSKTNSVLFWKNNKNVFPNLFKIAEKYFSANIERSFSMAKYVLPDQCGALKKENAAKRVFLYVNSDLID